ARLAGVAELEKEADLDSSLVEAAARLGNVLDPRAFVHCVEDLLRAGLGADPHGLRTGAAQRLDGIAFEEQVGPLEALEWDPRTLLLDQIGKPLDPAGFQAKDVVDVPDVVGAVRLTQPG